MPLPKHLQQPEARFCHVADEWLLTYAHINTHGLVGTPMVFSIAMAIELYLKAYHVAIFGNPSKTTKRGHNLVAIIEEIRQVDSAFPDLLKIRPHLSQLPVHDLSDKGWNLPWYTSLSQDDQQELHGRYELYMVVSYIADLKYGISPPLDKHGNRLISSSWTILNPMWANIAVFIRRKVGFPVHPYDDVLHYALKNPQLTESSRAYIQSIYDRTHGCDSTQGIREAADSQISIDALNSLDESPRP